MQDGYEEFYGESKEDVIDFLDSYSEEEKRAGVYEAYLRLEEPLIVDWEGRNWDDGPEHKTWEVIDDNNDTVEWLYSQEEADAYQKKNPDAFINESTEKDFDNTNDVARQAQEMGMDGAIIKNVIDVGSFGYADGIASDIYIVFDPNQIKSATDNTGEFSRGEDDIRYSKIPGVLPDRWKAAYDKRPKVIREDVVKIPGTDAVLAENKFDRRVILGSQQIGYAEISDGGEYGVLEASHIIPPHLDVNPKALRQMAKEWPRGLKIDRTKPLPDNWMDLAREPGAWADAEGIYLENVGMTPISQRQLFDPRYNNIDSRLQVRASLETIPLGEDVKYSKLPSIDPDIEASRTFAVKIFERRAEKQLAVNNITKNMEREIQRLAGAIRKKSLLSDATTKNTASSRELSMAMMIYRDLGGNTTAAPKFLAWAHKQIGGKMTAVARMRLQEKVKIVNRALNLTAAQKKFVDTDIEKLFAEVGQKAMDAGVINSVIDDYVRRIWVFPESDRGPDGGPGTPYTFKVFTTASKQRKLDTILDGWMRGYELKAGGIHNSFDAIATEISNIEANQAFIVEGRSTKDLSGVPLLTTKKEEGYVELKASGFQVWVMVGTVKPGEDYGDLDAFLGKGEFELEVNSHGKKVFLAPPNDDMAVSLFEKQSLRAPKDLAVMINKMTQGESLFSETPTLQAVNKMNASLKGWILLSSFFHHMAGARSWFFGVNHGFKNGAWDPIAAHKAGLKKIEGHHDLIMLAVKNGLTLDRMQDFD